MSAELEPVFTDGTVSALAKARRFARIVVADPGGGDSLVRRFLQETGDIDLRERGTVEVMKPIYAGLIQTALRMEDDAYFSASLPRLEHRALEEIETLSWLERASFELLYLEEFDIVDVGKVLSLVDELTVDIEREVSREAFSFKRRVIVVDEDEQRATTFARAASATNVITIWARTAEEARQRLLESRFDLIIGDPSLPRTSRLYLEFDEEIGFMDGRSYYVHAVPSELDGGLEVEGPKFYEHLFRKHLRSALYLDPHRWFEADETFESTDATSQEISDDLLAPVLAPIDAEVVEDQLQLAPSDQPDAVVPFEALDAVRRHHLEEALALADDLRASNGAPRVQRRFDAVASLLAQPLTVQMILALGVAKDALARLLPTIQDEFMALPAADMAVFIEDLQRFANQFPAYRQFNAEASAGRPIATDEEEALQAVVTVLVDQPDEVVSPALKEQLDLINRSRAKQVGSQISDVAWVRSIANSLRAVSREARRLGLDILGHARKTVVSSVGSLIGALPTAGALWLLGSRFPTEFAAVMIVLSKAKETIEQAAPEEDGDEVGVRHLGKDV